jgi:hypothetical protein
MSITMTYLGSIAKVKPLHELDAAESENWAVMINFVTEALNI